MQLFWFEGPMTASYSRIECVLFSHLIELIKTWACRGFLFKKKVFTTYETGTSSIWIHWNKGFLKKNLQAILRNTQCYLVSINNGFCETTWSPSKRPVLIVCWMGFLWIRMVSMSCSQVSDSIHPSLCRSSTVQNQRCRFKHAESLGKCRICQHNMLIQLLLTLVKKVCPHAKDCTCLFCLFQALLHERYCQAEMNCQVHQIRSTEPADVSHHVLTILYNREAALGAGYGSQFA